MFDEGSTRWGWYASVIVATCVCFGVLFLVEVTGRPSEQVTPPRLKTEARRAKSWTMVGGVRIPLPGESCDKVLEILGKPSEEDGNVRTWKKEDFVVTAKADPLCNLDTIQITMKPHREALTESGITLGRTTLAHAERILGPHMTQSSEKIEGRAGYWVGVIELYPSQYSPYFFTTTYRAALSSKKTMAMKRDVVFSDLESEVVSEYGLEQLGRL
jgi:hypothetical protein